MPLVVYFDEVGNPTLDASDRDFPVFAIVFFVCDTICYVEQIVPRLSRLKFDFFGHEGVVLHSRDIRKAQGDFGILTDAMKRASFYSTLNEAMTACDFELIPVVIRKDILAERYRYPDDPYELALTFALERLLFILEAAGQKAVTIVAEMRGKREDRELFTAFQRVVTAGTQFVDGSRFRRVSFQLKFLPKSMNIIGTQMADLAAYPVARHALNPDKPNPAFEVIRSKFYRGRLKIFP